MDTDMQVKDREAADNKLIDDAFQHLLDTYLASRHRKKVDIITKECADCRANRISCIL